MTSGAVDVTPGGGGEVCGVIVCRAAGCDAIGCDGFIRDAVADPDGVDAAADGLAAADAAAEVLAESDGGVTAPSGRPSV